jgi:hypothetical protein
MKTAIASTFFFRKSIYHIEEWIQHHLNFGVDKIFLYESSDYNLVKPHEDTKRGINISELKYIKEGDICDFYLKIKEKYQSEVIFVRYNPKLSPHLNTKIHDPWIYNQMSGLFHFKNTFSDQFDWVSSIDLDEYLYSKNFKSLKDILKAFAAYDFCIMKWMAFESCFLNLNTPNLKKTQCLEPLVDVLNKYIYKTSCNKFINNISLHHPKFIKKNKSKIIRMDFDDLGFLHFKLNDLCKESIEHWSKKKYNFSEFNLHFKYHYNIDYDDFVDLPNKQEISQKENLKLLNSFDWDYIV